MTSPINSTTSTATSSAAASSASSAASSSSATLGQDAFFKLLIAQLQNQDPLQPMDGTQFVTQLAQFTQVEQSVAQTQSLSSISAQLTGIQANDAVSLIGKQVTVSGQNFNFDGTDATTGSVTLSGAASNVSVSITDSTGKTIRTLSLGKESAGPLTVTWDGRDNSGQLVAAGSYGFTVSAATSNGASVGVSQNVTGVVTKVTYSQGYAAVVLDSGITAPVSNLVSAAAPPASP
jgi:flagellar basal-body rod modification protein FlgD